MSFKINETLYGALYINDREFTSQAGNAVNSIHIAAHTKNTLPTLQVTLFDMFGAIPELGLTDGSSIQVKFTGAEDITRNFRVHGWSRNPQGNGFTYTINGYWDAPRYFVGSTARTIRGTSADALKEIANTCELDWHVDNVETSDSMLWVPRNATFGIFAKQISRYGYVDSSAYLGLAVDTRGVLRYRDLDDLDEPKYNVTYLVTEANDVQLLDFNPTVTSGNNNLLTGYYHDRIVQSAHTDQVSTTISEQTVNTKSIEPLVNLDLREEIVRGGVSYTPIDFGNVHANYEQARYQNIRIGRLNSLMGEFLFGVQTPFEAFDTFVFAYPNEQGSAEYNGTYIVTGKVIYTGGSSYYEKVLAVRMGLN
jgi:hypothetical protein